MPKSFRLTAAETGDTSFVLIARWDSVRQTSSIESKMDERSKQSPKWIVVTDAQIMGDNTMHVASIERTSRSDLALGRWESDLIVRPRGPTSALASALGLHTLRAIPGETGADLLARGDSLLAAFADAVGSIRLSREKNLRVLRRLRMWAPECFERVPIVRTYLEENPDVTHGGLLRLEKSRGRSDAPLVLLSNLLAVDALILRDGIDAKRATDLVAGHRTLTGNVTGEHLANEFASHRGVVEALGRGYMIVAEELVSPARATTPIAIYSIDSSVP